MRVPIRWRGLAGALLIGALPGILAAAGDGVRTVDVRRVTEAELVRPAEALGGSPTDGNRLVLRTDPGVRAGVHAEIALRLPPEQRRTVVRAVFEWYAPGEATPRRNDFSLPPGALRGPDLTLALTGTGDPGVMPVAWRIQLLDNADTILAQRASALW